MTQQRRPPNGPVEMLPGVSHYETSGFAASWEAYDALTEVDGWDVKFSEHGQWKRNTVDGRNLVVHAPGYWDLTHHRESR